jgi:protein ImuA
MRRRASVFQARHVAALRWKIAPIVVDMLAIAATAGVPQPQRGVLQRNRRKLALRCSLHECALFMLSQLRPGCFSVCTEMQENIAQHYPPRARRAHEVCGPGACSFAFALAAQTDRPVIWVREAWRSDSINPQGAAAFFNPDDLLVARARDQTELLAVSEEALRSGAVDLVVLEVSKAFDLTAGRRLQLAAEAGKATALAIIPEGMGSNAAESRWHCTPVFDPEDSTLQRWKLIKNKSGTLGDWNVRWDAEARRVIVASQAGQRPGSQDAAG